MFQERKAKPFRGENKDSRNFVCAFIWLVISIPVLFSMMHMFCEIRINVNEPDSGEKHRRDEDLCLATGSLLMVAILMTGLMLVLLCSLWISSRLRRKNDLPVSVKLHSVKLEV
jgi:hypothetical protein